MSLCVLVCVRRGVGGRDTAEEAREAHGPVLCRVLLCLRLCALPLASDVRAQRLSCVVVECMCD